MSAGKAWLPTGALGSWQRDHGVRARPVGEMVPLIDTVTPTPSPVGVVEVTCWCERERGYVTTVDVMQGRTWACGYSTCKGDAPNAELQPSPRAGTSRAAARSLARGTWRFR